MRAYNFGILKFGS